jgi:hypothetical protein
VVVVVADRPVRAANFRPGDTRLHGAETIRLHPIDFPPVVPVGNGVELVVLAPLRVDKRLPLTATVPGQCHQLPMLTKFRRPQAGAVPGHVGVTPAGKGESAAVRRQAGGGYKVAVRKQYLTRGNTLQGQGNQRVARLTLAPVVLAHAQQPGSGPVEDTACIAQRLRGSDSLGFAAGDHAVQTLVLEVGEPDGAICHQYIAPTVFLHPGPGIPGLRQDFLRLATAGPAHDSIATTLLGTRFDPIQVIAVNTESAEAAAALHYRGG